jgi:hypothetical protein
MQAKQIKFIKSHLGSLIRQGLIRKYGKLPSASNFANQYNLRAHGTVAISREAARKWMAGLSVPEIDKLSILVQWLEIVPAEIFQGHLFDHAQNEALQCHDKKLVDLSLSNNEGLLLNESFDGGGDGPYHPLDAKVY